MNGSYKITSQPSDRAVVILLNGKFDEDALPGLDESIAAARDEHRSVVMDLSEVTLIDRKAVQFLVDRSSRDVTIVNCPVYLRRWITQEPMKQVNDEG